jgi:Leucine-rich repeat (LRR) protein
MTPATFTSDEDVIRYLKDICQFTHVLDDGCCTEISFHNDEELFGGTIRKHPAKREIVETVAKFQHLKRLILRKCKIGQMPSLASRCLEHLDLSCNDLEVVPDWVTQQSSLKYLSLGANNLQEIPDLSHLPLETLKLHKNSISRLPALGNCIKSLNLFLNKFPGIPEDILRLPLEVFTFGLSEGSQMPNLAALPNLRWLTVSVTQIERLPDGICSLQKLEGLQLAKNKLKELPKNIGDMNLRFLTVYSNDLRRLPESFFDLKLKKLNTMLNPLENKNRILEVFGDIDYLRV